MIRLITPTPPPPDLRCLALDAAHKYADVVIDTEPGLRDIERLGLRLGVALLHAWLRPASCPAPIS